MRARFGTVLLALGTAAGCAIESPSSPEVASEAQALGQPCTADSQCASWEYCSIPQCLTPPCSSTGMCSPRFNFQESPGVTVPDNQPTGITRTFNVGYPSATVASLSVLVRITHSYRGDLKVVLRSPSGTLLTLASPSDDATDNLVIDTVPTAFNGEAATGNWTLNVSDNYAEDVGTLDAWRLVFTYAQAPQPQSLTDVWAQVPVSGIESTHPYKNYTSQTFDIRPYLGGATKIKVHFTRIDTESGYDFVDILNGATGGRLQRISGSYVDVTSRELTTNNLRIRFTSDEIYTGWGFQADRIDVFGAGCLEDNDCPTGYHCPVTRICVRAPCFQVCEPVKTSGQEGDPCTASTDCEETLYCQGGTCRKDGSCSTTADCSASGNDWVHIMCVGSAACSAGSCAWNCSTPTCDEGATRNDGCNTCTCRDGQWLCTERACLGTEGSACGGTTSISCASGLTCDYGRTDSTNACMNPERAGTCVRTPDTCATVIAPACACNGQTFDNDCRRIGLVPFAKDGPCTLDLAIPDNNATGVTAQLNAVGHAASRSARVQLKVAHPYRGDLIVTLTPPGGASQVLTSRSGGSLDDFTYDRVVDTGTTDSRGTWTVTVSDRAAADVGKITFFNVTPQ
ncbi:MAG: proprotein convertase P-domain-containing protein [Deltaproteobacteria bacterium]|nr:proprotein convertase P-domain-containing protein [Deltaproteobacteria bacterium]